MTLLQDSGIIIYAKAYGETSLLLTVFSQSNGLIKGYVKGGRLLKNSSIYQKGNLISFEHIKKLPHQLGTVKGETILCLWGILSDNHFSFYAFNALCDLIIETLAENVPEEDLFQEFLSLVQILSQEDKEISGKKIALFLKNFLSYLGFTTDFHRCSVTGRFEDVIYVSPKTGNAISKNVGLPYHDKLFLLPPFLQDENQISSTDDIRNAVQILGFLIEKYMYYPQNKTIKQSFFDFYDKI